MTKADLDRFTELQERCNRTRDAYMAALDEIDKTSFKSDLVDYMTALEAFEEAIIGIDVQDSEVLLHADRAQRTINNNIRILKQLQRLINYRVGKKQEAP